MSRASTQIPLTGLFLAATHGPKTRLSSQGEHALIRPWLWTLASDVGSHNLPTLRRAVLGSDTKCETLKIYNLNMQMRKPSCKRKTESGNISMSDGNQD
jgi:hypothetical protein